MRAAQRSCSILTSYHVNNTNKVERPISSTREAFYWPHPAGLSVVNVIKLDSVALADSETRYLSDSLFTQWYFTAIASAHGEFGNTESLQYYSMKKMADVFFCIANIEVVGIMDAIEVGNSLAKLKVGG